MCKYTKDNLNKGAKQQKSTDTIEYSHKKHKN